MLKMNKIKSRINILKDVLKIYMSLTGGSIGPLGIVALKMVDCFDDIGDGKDPSDDLDQAIVAIIVILYESVHARIVQSGEPGVTNKQMIAKLEHEKDPYLHLTLLKTMLIDLSIITSDDYSVITEKIQEMQSALR